MNVKESKWVKYQKEKMIHPKQNIKECKRIKTSKISKGKNDSSKTKYHEG